MAKSIKVAFSERAEDQQRLRQVGGSIVFAKNGKAQFSFLLWITTGNGSGLEQKLTKERRGCSDASRGFRFDSGHESGRMAS